MALRVSIGIGMGVCGGDCYCELPRIPIPRTRVNNTLLTYGRDPGLLGGQSLPLSRWYGLRVTKHDAKCYDAERHQHQGGRQG